MALTKAKLSVTFSIRLLVFSDYSLPEDKEVLVEELSIGKRVGKTVGMIPAVHTIQP